MTPESGRRVLMVSFFLALAILTWQEVRDAKVFPRPRRYISAGIVYGLLGVVAPFISFQVAGLLGVGMILALFYQKYQSTKESNPSQISDEGTATRYPSQIEGQGSN